MFDEVLFLALQPLLSDELSESNIRSLSSTISRALEANPREVEHVPLLRESILTYLKHAHTQAFLKKKEQQQKAFAENITSISSAIQDLQNLSAKAFKLEAFSDITDNSLAKEIFNLNFGFEKTLGEIIYQTKFNQGGERQ